MFKVMITGNRPFKLDKDKALIAKKEMLNAITKLHNKHDDLVILTGMALGPDQWAADICAYYGIPFDAYLPFKDQDSRWKWHEQEHYAGLMSRARNVFIAETNAPIGGAAYLKRNSMMVNDCNCAIVVWNGEYQSGTGSTVRKIINAKKPYINFYPI